VQTKQNHKTVRESIAELIGQLVVLDTATTYIYIGTLVDADDYFYVLRDADVSNTLETHSPKEKYLLDAVKSGHHPTRRMTYVLADKVVSVSRLADVCSNLANSED